MTRINLLLAIATAGTAAHAVQAQSCNGGRTYDEVIAACDAAFAGFNPLIISARGWCYLINGATCVI